MNYDPGEFIKSRSSLSKEAARIRDAERRYNPRVSRELPAARDTTALRRRRGKLLAARTPRELMRHSGDA